MAAPDLDTPDGNDRDRRARGWSVPWLIAAAAVAVAALVAVVLFAGDDVTAVGEGEQDPGEAADDSAERTQDAQEESTMDEVDPASETQEPGEDETVAADQPPLREAAPDDLRIGAAAAGGGHHLAQPYPDPFSADEAYQQVLAREFDSLTPENQLKWDFVRPSRDRFQLEPADEIVAFAREHGQDVRGHTLMWHGQNPSWLENGDFAADELRDILREHIDTVVGRYAGQIQQWDVVNEVFDDDAQLRMEDNIWLRELGVEAIADAFRWAHEADPDALLFVNDYNVEGLNDKSTAYYELVQELLADDVPIHGFGMQGHLSTQFGFPPGVEDNLRRFDELGLETAVTEIDVRIPLTDGVATDAQLATQAEYYGRMLDACLNVAGCRSFTLWGVTDTYSWVPGFFDGEGAANVLDEQFAPKPAYHELLARLAEGRG